MRLKRTHTCGELRLAHRGQEVALNGWVDAVRDHGSVAFIELRDRYGSTQVMVDPARLPAARDLKAEWVVAVRGRVEPRPPESRNPGKPTGEIDLHALEIEVLNASKTPPFEVVDDLKTREELRLEYRYVDMRRRPVLEAMLLRSRLTSVMRRVLEADGFVEVETPVLMKTSPEGARDFIVPTRGKPGWVYGLPQSPQLFKQTLMVSGIDKYYQICKCFRDEDLRADRQPEFTQLDLEMSFVTQEDVFRVIEAVITAVYRELPGREVPAPFPRLSYHEALRRFGSDKPDTRFGLELFDLGDAAAGCGFRVFEEAVAAGGAVRGLRLPGGAELSRKEIDQAEAVAKEHGAKGLAWAKLAPEGPTGGIAKFLAGRLLDAVKERSGAGTGDLLLFAADAYGVASNALGQVRLHLGRTRKLVDAGAVHCLWVTDFPLFEWNPDESRWQAMHHMFTAPREPLPPKGQDLSGVRADLYDLVINGSEIGSGSVRIHRPEVQQQVFDLVGISREEAELKFGWFLRALDYGAPPHGGIALGLDRLAMILAGAASLRDVIAFPKTASGACPLTGSPSPADPRQWEELGLRVAADRPGGEGAPSGGDGTPGA